MSLHAEIHRGAALRAAESHESVHVWAVSTARVRPRTLSRGVQLHKTRQLSVVSPHVHSSRDTPQAGAVWRRRTLRDQALQGVPSARQHHILGPQAQGGAQVVGAVAAVHDSAVRGGATQRCQLAALQWGRGRAGGEQAGRGRVSGGREDASERSGEESAGSSHSRSRRWPHDEHPLAGWLAGTGSGADSGSGAGAGPTLQRLDGHSGQPWLPQVASSWYGSTTRRYDPASGGLPPALPLAGRAEPRKKPPHPPKLPPAPAPGACGAAVCAPAGACTRRKVAWLVITCSQRGAAGQLRVSVPQGAKTASISTETSREGGSMAACSRCASKALAGAQAGGSAGPVAPAQACEPCTRSRNR